MKLFALFGIVISTTAALQAQTAKEAAVAPHAPQAQATKASPSNGVPQFITVSETLHDYGTIEKGSDPYCQFKLTNNSNDSLTIKEAHGSCGCTVPEYPKEAITPGHSVVMKVRYDTNRTGPFEKNVTVSFAGKDDQLVLKIKGMVKIPPAEQPFGSEPVLTGPRENN